MIYTWKLNVALFLSHFLVNISTANIDKVVSMLFFHRRWTYVDSTFLFNQISTLKQHWVINNESTYFFQSCFVNVQTTSINIRRLRFHFQPNFNVETMLMNVDDQRCFNVDSTLMHFLGWYSAVVFIKVQPCKLYKNKYTIASTQITNTETFAFIAALVFKLLSRKVLFMNRKTMETLKK